MSDGMTVLRTLYRRLHARDAEDEATVLVWAAEQLALLLEQVKPEEPEDDAPPEPLAAAVLNLNAEQMAQLNEDAKR